MKVVTQNRMSNNKKILLIGVIALLLAILVYIGLNNNIFADIIGAKLQLNNRVASFSNSKFSFNITSGCVSGLRAENNSFYQNSDYDFASNVNKYGLVLKKPNDDLVTISPPSNAEVSLPAQGGGNELLYRWTDATFGPLSLSVKVIDRLNGDPEISYNGQADNGFLAGTVICMANLKAGGAGNERTDYVLPARDGILLDEKVTESTFPLTENNRLPRFNPALIIGRNPASSFLFWNAEVPMDSSYALSFSKFNVDEVANYSFYAKSYNSSPWDSSKKTYQGIPWRLSAQKDWLSSVNYYSAWQRNQLGMIALSKRVPNWPAETVLGIVPTSGLYENEGKESLPIYTQGRQKFLENVDKIVEILGENKLFVYLQQSATLNFKRDANGIPHQDQLTDEERTTNYNNFYSLTHSQIMSDFLNNLRITKSKVMIYGFNTVSYYNNPLYPLNLGIPFLRDILYPSGTFDLNTAIPYFDGRKPNYTLYGFYMINPAIDSIRSLLVSNLSSLFKKETVDGVYFDTGFGASGFPKSVGGKTVAAGQKLLQKEFGLNPDNKDLATYAEVLSADTFSPTNGPAFVYGDSLKNNYALEIEDGCEASIDQVYGFYSKHLFPITSMLYGKYTKVTFNEHLLWNTLFKKNSEGKCTITSRSELSDLEYDQEHRVRDYYERSGWAGLTVVLDNVYANASDLIANAKYGVPRVIRENALIFSKRGLVVSAPPTFEEGALSYYQSKEGTWFKFKRLFEGNKEIGSALIEKTPSGTDRLCYARIHAVSSVPDSLSGSLAIPSENPDMSNGQLDPTKWYSLFSTGTGCEEATDPNVINSIFPSGFTAIGNTKRTSKQLFTDSGLYLYKFSGASNNWQISNQPNSPDMEPFQGYYVYNPSSDAKTLPIPSYSTVADEYQVTSGWNMLWSPNQQSQAEIWLEINNQTKSIDDWIARDKVRDKIYIINNERSNDPCEYFKLLSSVTSPANCSGGNQTLGTLNKIPAGKSFWVYVK